MFENRVEGQMRVEERACQGQGGREVQGTSDREEGFYTAELLSASAPRPLWAVSLCRGGCEAVLCIVGHSTASLSSTHEKLAASPSQL